MNKPTKRHALACAAATLLVAGCAVPLNPADVDAATQAAIKSSFRDQSWVKVDRLV